MENRNKNLEIKFGGDLHEIDADLLIESLVNYSSVTQEASAYLSPGIRVNIKIKAPKQGSFIILLDLIAQNGGDLFTKDNIQKLSESLGHFIYKSLDNPFLTLNADSVMKGLKDAKEGKTAPMTEQQYEELLQKMQEVAFDDMSKTNLKEAILPVIYLDGNS